MTNEEYQTTQKQLMLLAGLIRGLDLQGFLEAIATAETVAPVLDPTLWMRGSRKLEQIKRIAQGAAKFKAAVDEVAAPRQKAGGRE